MMNTKNISTYMRDREDRYQMKKRLLSLLLILMLLFSMIPGTAAFAQTAEGNTAEQQAEGDSVSLRAAKTKTVLTFTSDIHNSSENVAANRLDKWLDIVIDKYGGIDAMGFCGDMGSASANESQFWTYTQSVVDVFKTKDIPHVIYTTGNHEFYNGKFDSTANSVHNIFTVGEKGLEAEDYIIYCLGTENWNNSSDNYTQEQIDKMAAFLATTDATKPVIILTHFPIHCYSSGGSSGGWGGWGGMSRTTANADRVIDALNTAAGSGRTIVLLWGHNHTLSDPHYDQVFAPGESVEYASGKTKTIQFYHMAAGCMSDTEYSGSGSAYVKGKGLVITIDSDKKLDFTYYDANGNDVTEDSSGNGPDNPDDPDDPTPSAGYYVIPEGTYCIKSDDGYFLTTAEGETYSNSGSGSASYNYTGLKGDSDIAKATQWEFIPAEGTDGYYIKNGSLFLNGSYTSNSSGGYDGALKVDETADVWYIVSNGNGGLILKSSNASSGHSSGDKYLSHGNGSSSSANTFTVRSNKENSTATTISYVKENNETVTPQPAENGQGGGDTPVDPPSGDTVSITPSTDNPEKSIEIKAGDTLIVNVTNGSSSSAYDFTATLSKSGIAEIQGNTTVNIAAGSTGKYTVKGLAEGTVDITIQNQNSYSSQYTRKGVVHVTVSESGGDEPIVISSSTFEQASTLTSGKRYVIASTDAAGSTDLLGANGTSITARAATITTVDGQLQIKNAPEDAIWTATASTADGKVLLSNSAGYLEGYQGNVVIHSLEYGDRGWTYTGSQLKHTGGSNTYVVYYSDGFTSTSDETSSKVYLFAETKAAEEPAGAFSLSVSGPETAEKGTDVVYRLDLASDDYETFAAADISFTYDTDRLTPKTMPEGAEDTDGTIRLLDFGEDKVIGEGVYTFTFTAISEGTATVTVTEAAFISSDDAATADMIEASLTVPVVSTRIGHDWGDPVWTWAQDYSTASVTFTCRNDAGHTVTYDAVITSVTVDPTPSSDGSITYTATAHDPSGTEISDRKTVTIPSSGYTYAAPAYEWVEIKDAAGTVTGYTVHGVQKCIEDETRNITETVNAALTVTAAATCETSGSGVWTAVFTKTGFENQTNPATIPALGHDWSEPSFTWAEDGSTATATRVCGNDKTHVETETVNTTAKVTKAPSCEEKGETTYTAVFENGAFGTKTLTVADADALGHDWSAVVYGWSTDNTVATATRTCLRDGSHSQTEVVATTAEITKAATCEEKGETTWTAVFKNEDFGTKTKTETIPALGHDWSEPSFTWAEDGSTATATRVCGNDKTHVETETVNTTARVTKAATCEEKGETTYIAAFRNAAFGTKTLTIADIDALGHDWSAAVYGWSADNSMATATRTCLRDRTHYETEITETTAVVTKAATCTNKGETTWTAVFANEAFETQTKKDTNVPALGHDWGTAAYVWSEDNHTVTATRTCHRDGSHSQTEVAAATAEITKAPTCEEKGETTWTAVFKNEDFGTKTKTEAIPALGHDWSEPDYGWSAGNARVTAVRICSRDSSHAEIEVSNATAEVTKPATCEEKGETTWTAVFKNEAFKTQVKKEANLPALGHDYTAAWNWAEDHSAATVILTCRNDANHKETVNAAVSSVKTEPTCTAAGKTIYTATATFEGKTYTDEKEVTIPATGHDYELSGWTWAEDHSSATVTYTCKRDKAHVYTDEAVITVVRVEPKPEEDGSITYTATAEDPAGMTVTDTKIEILPATGYSYKDPEYTWAAEKDDAGNVTGYRVTALMECNEDQNRSITETVSATSKVMTAAGCETTGLKLWTAVFTNTAFENKTKEEVIPVTGHAWGEAVYTWSEDNGQVTAERVCANDNAHRETETVSATGSVTKPATCEEKGDTTYVTAAFENSAFTAQRKTIANIEKLGHKYELSGWSWSADYSSATATFTCKNDETHKETVSAAVTSATVEATCETAGKTTYTATATFEGKSYTDAQEVAIPATGHDFKAAWTWTDTAEASVTVTCSRCETAETKLAEISFERQPVSAGSRERLVYTATAQAKGQTYTDQKIISLTEPVHVKAGSQMALKAPTGKDAYRWQYSKDGGETWIDCTSAGHDQATFSFKATAGLNGRLYRCVVTENGREDILEATDVSVLAIKKQPAAQEVKEGEKATFTVIAVGEGVTYQWQVNKTGTWNNCTSAGNKTATFSFTAKTSYSGWQYRCVVTNDAGSITSNAATLTVTPAAAKPVITRQPADQNVAVGETAVYTVTATGSGLTYQWQYSSNNGVSWNNCKSSGYNTAAFSFRMTSGLAGRQYRCVVSNAGGSVTSGAAKLTLRTGGPTITVQPVNQTVKAGSKAVFTVTATGDGLTYQWQVNKTGTWNNCTSAGNTTATFSFTAKASYSGWQYRCVVTDANGSVTTVSALLTVN